MTIIETITRTVPNNKEGKEYLESWLKSNEGNEYEQELGQGEVVVVVVEEDVDGDME